MLPSSDLLIIGAGPAGLSAAINGASEGLTVTVIEPHEIGGQARWSSAIENVPGFPHGITGADYTNRVYRQAKRFSVRFVDDYADTLCSLRDGTIAVQLRSARMAETRALIIACGLQPIPLSIPGAGLFGVFTGANPADLPRYANKTVAIIGGGNSAGQAAVAFTKHRAHVILFARHTLDATMSAYLVKRLRSDLDIRENVSVDAITRADGARLTLMNTTVDAVFAFVGSLPQHTLPVPCDEHGYVLTKRFATASPGIFAIGDVRATSTKRIATAVGEGSAVMPIIHAYLSGGAK